MQRYWITLSFVLLVVALPGSWTSASAQSAAELPESGPDPAVSVEPGSVPIGGPVDVYRVDNELYQSMAVKLPQGQSLKIDGRLGDPAWRLARPSGNFIQREPRVGQPMTERTEFRILYDDRNFYVAIWCFDSNPNGILASELKRDSGLHKGDMIKVAIDTFHDHRNSFYFSTNPLGAYKDGAITENGRAINFDWNAVWECKTSVDERGWYVEIAIPLSQLRFKSSPGESSWGLNVARIVARKNEEGYWVPYPREWSTQGMARMSHAGHLFGFNGLQSRRRFELVPFTAPMATRDYTAGTAARFDAKYGFDMRVGLTSDFTADATFKTDFAQVEADQEVVNTTRFSLFFPEKRQFFTESAGIFDFGRNGGEGQDLGLLPVFYTRRIGLAADGREIPLVGGGRVTGRSAGFAVGLMNMETDQTRYRSGLDDVFVPRSNYTVLRVKRNVLAESYIGTTFLNRQVEGGGFNRTAGVDAGFTFGRTTVNGLLAKTMSPGVTGKDTGGAAELAWTSDRFNYRASYLDVPERFNAEMGFIQRIDVRNPRVSASWTPRPKWRGVRQITVTGNADYYENHAGLPESRNQGAAFTLLRQDGSSLNLTFDRDYDRLPYSWTIGAGTIPTGGYTWNTFHAKYSTTATRRIYGGPTLDVGGYYGGTKRSYRADFNFLPRDTLLVETNYTRNEITLPGRATYATNTLNSRVSYSFSPDLFLKGFFQYNDDKKLASFNVLFWYIYRPGSDLYVVYNNGWDTNLPGQRAFQVRNRSLAVKLTFWVSR